MANRVQAATARRDFANLMERSAGGERIKVTRYGRTLAALIPKSDLTKLEDCEKGQPPVSSVSRPSALASPPLRRRRRKPA